VELGRSLFEEGRRALLLVFGRRTEAKIGSFEQQPFALAGLQPFISNLERELDRNRGVGGDLFDDCFGTRDQISGRNDFVDEPNAIGLCGVDYLSGG
jgi:hypothetical protein